MREPKLPVETQERGRQFWVQQIVGGLIGAFILLLLIESDVKLPPLSWRFIVQAAIAIFLSVAAHEAGHLIGGGLGGLRPLIIAVWPIKLQREASSWRVTYLRSNKLSGFVSMDPGGESNLARRLLLMVVAGPLASSVVGAAAAGLVLAAPVWNEWIIAELKLVAFWSFSFAVIGFIPIPSRHAVNDGMRLRMLLRRDEQADRFCVLMLLSASLLSGSRPRDWKKDLIDRLPGPLDGFPDALSAQTSRYNFFLDSGSLDEADSILDWIVAQKLPGEARAIWSLEAAWFQARFRSDLQGARQWMEAAPTKVKTHDGRCALWKARAAIAFLEERWVDAEAAVEQALKACDRMADTGITRVIREEVKQLIEETDAAKKH